MGPAAAGKIQYSTPFETSSDIKYFVEFRPGPACSRRLINITVLAFPGQLSPSVFHSHEI